MIFGEFWLRSVNRHNAYGTESGSQSPAIGGRFVSHENSFFTRAALFGFEALAENRGFEAQNGPSSARVGVSFRRVRRFFALCLDANHPAWVRSVIRSPPGRRSGFEA